jgi:hypothetical protein
VSFYFERKSYRYLLTRLAGVIKCFGRIPFSVAGLASTPGGNLGFYIDI